MTRSTRTMVTIDLQDLEKMIRKIVRHDVRQIVREELARTGAEVVEPWMSDPEMRSSQRPKLLTYDEVFGK